MRGRFGEQVARDLLDRELVEWLVLVEGSDDPVPPVPHVAATVDVKAVRVGVARQVEPLHGHALAIVGRIEQAVHLSLVGVRRGVAQEAVHVGRVGRQAGQVEGQSAEQRPLVGFGCKLQARLAQACGHEPVNLVGRAVWGCSLRDGWPGGRFVGPVRTPFGALVDPATDGLDLFRSGPPLGRGWRHARHGFGMAHALVQAALGGVSRDDETVTAAICKGALACIEAQVGLAGVSVGSVASEAAVGEDRANVLLEVDPRWWVDRGSRRCGGSEAG